MNPINNSIEDSDVLPEGFVDLHTHLVPGVDDGARSPEDSAVMLQQARESGTVVVAATPHVYPGVMDWNSLEAMLQARDQWVERANREFSQISVVPGAEVHCTHAVLEALNRFDRRLTLNGGDYFLLEFPFEVLFPRLEELIFQLQRGGWIPIIAHPERNQVIQRSPGVLFRLVLAGVLVQINTGSLDGQFGEDARRSAWQLLANNLVHVVASDAHWPRERPPDMSTAESILMEHQLGDPDRLLRRNPANILSNQGIERMAEPLDPAVRSGGIISRLRQHFQGRES